jgi:hypothetical protein
VISQPTNTLVEDYTWFAPMDPAFRQPPDEPSKEAPPAMVAAYEKARDEHAALWKRAVETGNYDDVTIPGSRPTAFVLRHLGGMRRRKIYSAMQGVGTLEVDATLVRACVVSIIGPDYKPKTTSQYGIELATEELIDWLDAAHPQLVATMAVSILKKAGAPGK